MKSLKNIITKGLHIHLSILCLLLTSSPLLAIEPIATIGQPLPVQHAFLNNNSLIRVVPTQIHIVDVDTNETVDVFGECTDFCDVIFSPSSSHLAILNHTTNPRTTTVSIWDTTKREKISQWLIESVIYDRAAFNPVQPIFAAYLPSEIVVWNWKTGESVAKIPRVNFPTFRAMSFSADGSNLFVASDRYIELWNVESERYVGNFDSKEFDSLEGLTVSPNGKFIAIYEQDSSVIYMLNTVSQQLLWENRSGLGRIVDMQFSPNSQNLFVATATSGIRRSGTGHWQGWDDQVRVWDVESGQQTDKIGSEFSYIESIAISPNEQMALLQYRDGTVLWDIEEMKQLKVWADYPSWITALSPDGKTIISLSQTHLKSWDIPSQKLNILQSSEGATFNNFAFSPDGQKLAVSKDPWIEILDLQSGKVEIEFPEFIGTAEAMAFSPSGELLVVGNDFGKIFILDTNSNETIQTIETGVNGIPICLFSNVMFSANGDYLVTTGYPTNNQYSILVWIRVGNTFVNLYSWMESTDSTESTVDFSSTDNGKTVLAVTSSDGINIWQLLRDSPQLLTTINGWYKAHFSSDENYLITQRTDELQIWNWQTQTPLEQVIIPRLSSVSQDESVITSFNNDKQIQVYDGSKLFPTLAGLTIHNTKDMKTVTFGQLKRNQLYQNYPNPFNPETWIPFRLAEDSKVTINIFNSLGSLVRSLSPGTMKAGDHSSQSKAIHWDGKNNNGEPVSSGVYFYTINAGNFSATRKMIVKK